MANTWNISWFSIRNATGNFTHMYLDDSNIIHDLFDIRLTIIDNCTTEKIHGTFIYYENKDSEHLHPIVADIWCTCLSNGDIWCTLIYGYIMKTRKLRPIAQNMFIKMTATTL